MNTTYDKIVQLCTARGIRLSSLAQAIGIRSSVFTELKKGRTQQLSAKTLQKVADYFGVSTDRLLESSEGTQADAVRDELYAKRRLLFDMSEKASAETLDTIIKIVGALIEQ
ncbi:MAG: helix-turn-helix transcriptional regulator [Clostridia bacterium]|nr:helix-turn-helix transcriptional regulator [Clostridia bacterium]MBR6779513.1 helix-turn-helix transcriptional regulator [Clostridia bacterium]